ncbi:hypothetical protein HBI16_193400 [Parastagonospora nodorum]|nr:hypothetical protein HBH75_205380 [Parastagonospora nodorum]KAH5274106.1 hypothetical protein HBI71_038770 [Parastagonospora nodorum]KAH5277478.1 hypothetical protein HBI72_029570 [Parastagonospora nodorum]KAH5759172.1 hypothetical protein HBI16_193400 [Parastagonospora nodorum]KAH6106337.1 hypothetical protein HBI69_181640 [Parastagonospora nodorum]
MQVHVVVVVCLFTRVSLLEARRWCGEYAARWCGGVECVGVGMGSSAKVEYFGVLGRLVPAATSDGRREVRCIIGAAALPDTGNAIPPYITPAPTPAASSPPPPSPSRPPVLHLPSAPVPR